MVYRIDMKLEDLIRDVQIEFLFRVTIPLRELKQRYQKGYTEYDVDGVTEFIPSLLSKVIGDKIKVIETDLDEPMLFSSSVKELRKDIVTLNKIKDGLDEYNGLFGEHGDWGIISKNDFKKESKKALKKYLKSLELFHQYTVDSWDFKNY